MGKTFVGAEKLIRLNSKHNLVVCQKSLIPMWIDHFKTYYDLQVIDCTVPKNITWMTENQDQSYIAVINYELLFRRKWFLDLTDFTLMLDESSLIQNGKAKRTKFILKMQPDNVILLSGTPVSGKYENLWTQAHLLGWKISEAAFNRTYVNWTTIQVGNMYHKIVDKEEPYQNIDRLKRKLRANGAVFVKTKEVYDLPEQTFIKRYVSPSKEYKKFKKNKYIVMKGGGGYGEFHDDSKGVRKSTPYNAKVPNGKDVSPRVELLGDTTLTERLGLRQLCGQYSITKLQATQDLIESTSDRLVIFYNFDAELKALKKLCGERPISEINGHVKNLDNYENCSDSITLVQYQAGSMGINLQKANKMIYFTLPEKSEFFEQSQKRIHRIGQDRPCFYYLMMCKGSLEEQIYQTLLERKDYTDELFIERFKSAKPSS
ncbi:DEAD/DEAH box helicase [Ligilactobacillus acidipiscis]|uniref:SNF2-related protein n=1 Tax=Ligilactobacillus acidipiscis TaxID=89059 RepID=UPI0022E546B7|nr:DEAD/DEAH box helicase [Ligilactobacillus acidipiscis]